MSSGKAKTLARMLVATPVPVAARITARLRVGRALNFVDVGLDVPNRRDRGKDGRSDREASLRHLAHVQPMLRRLMQSLAAAKVTPPIVEGHWQEKLGLHMLCPFGNKGKEVHMLRGAWGRAWERFANTRKIVGDA